MAWYDLSNGTRTNLSTQKKFSLSVPLKCCRSIIILYSKQIGWHTKFWKLLFARAIPWTTLATCQLPPLEHLKLHVHPSCISLLLGGFHHPIRPRCWRLRGNFEFWLLSEIYTSLLQVKDDFIVEWFSHALRRGCLLKVKTHFSDVRRMLLRCCHSS